MPDGGRQIHRDNIDGFLRPGYQRAATEPAHCYVQVSTFNGRLVWIGVYAPLTIFQSF
jgi:hypothetical protein